VREKEETNKHRGKQTKYGEEKEDTMPHRPLKKGRRKTAKSTVGKTAKAGRKATGKGSGGASGELRSASSGRRARSEGLGSPPFPIVGMGASAGGLQALDTFFRHMPPDGGMAFVVVLHLDPTHASIMPELLGRVTRMPVCQVKDGMKVEPNCVYVIPPRKDMAIMNERLQLMDSVATRGLRHPIDLFFRSLAQDHKERAICVVLSGTGTEGALGLKAIKGEGGLAMVQDTESAKFNGMPRSAIATQLADYVLPPEKMPARMLEYVRYFHHKPRKAPPKDASHISNLRRRMLFLIRERTGHDFTLYKQSVINRRIDRRMSLHQMGRLSDYVRYLQENPLEVEKLAGELLIGVTGFFRDREVYEILKRKVLPHLLKNKPHEQPFRVWVPGCSTGEEAYSVAMVLREHLGKLKRSAKVQVFATDIDEDAIGSARAGAYPDSIAVDVAAERLRRFFTRDDKIYMVNKEIREMVVFAPQDLIKDPPFSNLDMISCRNVLIYLGQELQAKLLRLFHYSLRPEGILLLGPSETIGQHTDLYSVFEKKWRFFKRKGAASVPDLPLGSSLATQWDREAEGQKKRSIVRPGQISMSQHIEKILLEGYAPPSAVVNEKGEILYFYGRTGRYLEPAPGKAGLNILQMAREDLRVELNMAIRQAVSKKKGVTYRGLQVKANGDSQLIDLKVTPITKPESLQGLLLVAFESVETPNKAKLRGKTSPRGSQRAGQRLRGLEQELKFTKDNLRGTIEELESSNQELRSLNEELQSSNEELESTNEEVETSREELQSINEELETVNAELHMKIKELADARDDMSNLLSSTEIALIFLDNDLRIRRFTPAATEVMKFIDTDLGRSLEDINSSLVYQNLAQDIRRVLKTLTPAEVEVEDRRGRTYLLRIFPYRSRDNVIDGVTVTLVDITDRKRAQREIQAAREMQTAQALARGIVETVRQPVLVLDAGLKVMSANRSFYQTFNVRPEQTEGRRIYELGNRQWDIPELRRLLETILPRQTSLADFEVEHEFPYIGRRAMLLSARQILDAENKATQMILLAMEDVTGRKPAPEKS
jgi:two-component system CheB/CheR fusion protein